jgi:hypothetical protein
VQRDNSESGMVPFMQVPVKDVSRIRISGLIASRGSGGGFQPFIYAGPREGCLTECVNHLTSGLPPKIKASAFSRLQPRTFMAVLIASSSAAASPSREASISS